VRPILTLVLLVLLIPSVATAGGYGCWICEYSPTTTGNHARCETPGDGNWGSGIKCSEVSLGNYQDCLMSGGMCLYTVVTPSNREQAKPVVEQSNKKAPQVLHLF
jgi:hypothetical protein